MTAVAFVTYKFADNARRVGPMDLEKAETTAKEVARRPMVTDVVIEEWVCLRIRKIESPA